MSDTLKIMGAAEQSLPSPMASRSGSIDGVQVGKVLDINAEDERLYTMGYEQHMKRGFGAWSMTAFCLTGLGLLPSVGGVYKDVFCRLFQLTVDLRHHMVQSGLSRSDANDMGLADCCHIHHDYGAIPR